MKVTIAGLKKAVTAAGTRVQLQSTSQWATGVRVKALAGNANPVYVGDSTVSSALGYQLAPGEELALPADAVIDLSTIYLDAQTNGEGATVFYYVGQR